jgi:hypothetical protein
MSHLKRREPLRSIQALPFICAWFKVSFRMRHVEKPDESLRADFGLRRTAQKTEK